jgi:hypothetical protein
MLVARHSWKVLKREGLYIFDVHVTVHCDKFLVIKPARCTNFSNLFWNKTLHVSGSSSVHHQEFFTVHTAMVYVIHFCWQIVSCQQTFLTYTIVMCTVKNSWWWTEELPETCKIPFQNKFKKLVHLVGFITRNLYNLLSVFLFVCLSASD